MKHNLATLGATVLVLALGGCAPSRGLVSDDGRFTWGFGDQPLRVLLGVQDTDNVYLGWVCQADGLTVMAPYQDAGTSLRLRSGSADRTYRLRPMQEVDGAEATTDLSDPVLQSFARTGRLSQVGEDGASTRLDAKSPLERSEVVRFVSACRAAQSAPAATVGIP